VSVVERVGFEAGAAGGSDLPVLWSDRCSWVDLADTRGGLAEFGAELDTAAVALPGCSRPGTALSGYGVD
jgi:hypothetical protein